MTLYDPRVQSALMALCGLFGFVAAVANLTHAVSPRSPAEPPQAKVRHFWAAVYFGGVGLMGVAYFTGWAPAPTPAMVWLTLCGAGWACNYAARLGRQYVRPPVRHRHPELPLFRRWACFWLIVGVSAGAPLVASTLPGCAANPTYTAEQKAQVIAERALQSQFTLIDDFLLFDDENRAWMRLKLPQVHDFAERLRHPGPDGVQAVVAAQRAAWTALDAMKKNPTAANTAAFDVAAEQVRAWAQQARKYLETAR